VGVNLKERGVGVRIILKCIFKEKANRMRIAVVAPPLRIGINEGLL
jgi:hypothetical protein